jgi:hypothetical protein
MSGLRSIHPPVAKPAQLTAMGAVMDMRRGNGADVLSGIASLKVRFALASVKEDMVGFYAWALLNSKVLPFVPRASLSPATLS